MNRTIYRKIAKQHRLTIQEVKKDMQEAINEAFISPNSKAKKIPRKGDVPTTDEFISYIVKRITNE